MLDEALKNELVKRSQEKSVPVDIVLWFFDNLQKNVSTCVWEVKKRYIGFFNERHNKVIDVDIQMRSLKIGIANAKKYENHFREIGVLTVDPPAWITSPDNALGLVITKKDEACLDLIGKIISNKDIAVPLPTEENIQSRSVIYGTKVFEASEFAQIITAYKEDFVSKQWPDEKYKWIAVKHFQDNWDIDAPNFAEMLKNALAKTGNLLVSVGRFPGKMIEEFAEVAPEQVRTMFQELFDETQDLWQRVKSFKEKAQPLLDVHGKNAKNHYQDENTIFTYLWLRYPEKYYIYKISEIKSVAETLHSDLIFKNGKYEDNIRNFMKLYDAIRQELFADDELKDLLKSQLSDDCYADEAFCTLTIDFGFYISRRYENSDLVIWKISHGPGVISDEEYAIFEKNKVAVVHGFTRAKGKEKETQGEKFIHKIQKGDYFYLCRGNSIRLLGQFNSDKAVINPEKQDDWYQRSYKVIAVSKNTESYTGARRWWTPNNNSTCYNVDDNKDFEDKILKPYFDLTLADLGQNNTETMSNPMIKELKELLLSSKQIILTGAPGTGKTYLAKQIAYALTGDNAENSPHIEFCQFHPSFDYTDFVEGLRSVDKGNGNIGFERKDGIFKAFCKRALKNYQDSQKSKQVIETERSAQDKIDAFLNDAVEKQICLKTTTGNEFYIREFDDRRIYIEIPGNEIKKDIIAPYAEVQKIISEKFNLTKPGDIKTIFNRTHNRQHDSYVYIICNKIRQQKNIVSTSGKDKVSCENFVFIIDEINRGDISKILGELFYAVDPGYRGIDGKVTTQYDNLIDETDLYYGGFYIPKNVYIIGTMNDIDRSVESMDFAIRRRFTWKEIEAKDAVSMWDDTIPEYKDEAFEKMTSLNKIIEQTESLSKAFHIGPAYFLKLKEYNGDFQKLWDLHIMPLLKEYLRGTFDTETALENLSTAYFTSSDSAIGE